MKKNSLIFLICAVLSLQYANAQLNDALKKATTSTKISAGSLLTQFEGVIKPTALSGSWPGEKAGWQGAANKVTDGAGMGKSISSLAGFIKPDMFKSGFKVQDLISSANKAKTLTDASGLLKNLEGGLKPEALLGSWAGQRTGWLSALSLLK